MVETVITTNMKTTTIHLLLLLTVLLLLLLLLVGLEELVVGALFLILVKHLLQRYLKILHLNMTLKRRIVMMDVKLVMLVELLQPPNNKHHQVPAHNLKIVISIMFC
jgi:hypothetical protein